MAITRQKAEIREKRQEAEGAPARVQPRPSASQDDLCQTCAVAQTCTRRRIGYPVHYCDDYVNPPDMEEPVIMPPTMSAKVKKTGEALGLCTECVHRATCAYAKSEGGVWHCSRHEEAWV